LELSCHLAKGGTRIASYRLHRILACVLTAVLLPSCTVAQPDPTPAGEARQPGIVALPSPWTATVPAGTSDVVPTPQSTTQDTPGAPQAVSQPAGTAIPSPSPTYEPLSVEGPWLILCDTDRQIVISDGSGPQVRIPASGNCYEQATVSTTTRRLAFLAGGAEGNASLRVLQLPGMEIVGEADLADAGLYDVEQISWSPDGGILAYVVTTRAEAAGLHAYTVGEASGRLLESRDGEISIMGWSPDGRWLVSLSGQGRLEDVWAVSFAASATRSVYHHASSSDTFYWGSILGWTGQSTLVMEEGPGEGCSFALREFNLDSGTGRILYGSPFVEPWLDPASRSVFLGIREPGMCVYDLEPGIYRVDMAAHSPRLILKGTGWERLFWLGPLGPLGVRTSDPAGIQAYTADGNRRTFFADAAELFASPDGAWALARTTGGGLSLVDRLGASSGMISDRSPQGLVWLPNSIVFYVLEDSGAVYRMAVEGDDRPTLVAESVLRILGILAP